MTRSAILGFAASLALSAMPVLAAEEEDFVLDSAEDLAVLCGKPGDASAIHMCHGFLIGVHLMHEAIETTEMGPIYCVPDDDATVTRNTVAADYASWVAANPSVETLPAHEGLLTWAKQAFPCS